MYDPNFKNTLIFSLRMVSFQTSQCLQDVVNLAVLLLIKCFANLKSRNIIYLPVWSRLSYPTIFPIYQSLIFWEKKTPKFIQINCWDETSFEAFHSKVKSHIESLDMNRDLFSDPNENYRQFEEIILKAKAKYLAPKTARFKKHKHKLSHWMTNGIINSIKFLDKLFLKLKTLNSGSELYDSVSFNLKSYNKILKKLIRQAKVKYYSDQFDKNKSNIRLTWSTIK